MPPRKVQFAPGQFYHVYNRGAGGQPIFCEEENYLFLLRQIKKHATALEVSVIATCLIPNHYHLLLRQDGPEPAGRLPQRVFPGWNRGLFVGVIRKVPGTEESAYYGIVDSANRSLTRGKGEFPCQHINARTRGAARAIPP